MHVVTLSFDDGFERSSRLTAEIFERHGLVAELNVVAAGHVGEPDDAWHNRWRKGDFALWNELKARGHHVMPHGYRHANKAELPPAEAEQLIERVRLASASGGPVEAAQAATAEAEYARVMGVAGGGDRGSPPPTSRRGSPPACAVSAPAGIG